MPMFFDGADRPREPTKAPGEVKGLRCAEPECDGVLELLWSSRFECWFYGCSHFPRCKGTLPAEVDGAPRGKPRTKELQGWRVKAHAAFDTLWKGERNRIRRHTAYAWLRRVMVLPPEQAHISKFDIEQCQKVIRLVDEKGPRTDFWRSWYRPGKRIKPRRRGSRR